MLDIVVKIAERTGPKYFESALAVTTPVAAGLSLYHRALVYDTAAEAPALPAQFHLSLELLLCTAAGELHHGKYFQ